MQNKYFKTSSFHIALHLFVKGMELISVDRTDARRCKFVFLDIPQRKQLVEDFNFAKEDAPEVVADIRKIIAATKSLKDKLYQEDY